MGEMGQNDLNYLRKIHEASDLEGLGSLSHKFSSSTNGSKAKPQQPQVQPRKNLAKIKVFRPVDDV